MSYIHVNPRLKLKINFMHWKVYKRLTFIVNILYLSLKLQENILLAYY